MSEQIFTWITPVWLAVVIFLVGWITTGVVASVLLKRGHILAFIPAAAFGFGGYILLEVQLAEGDVSPAVLSIVPVIMGVFCILILFLAYGKDSPQKEEKKEEEK